MSDIFRSTRTIETDGPTLFQKALADRWHHLPLALQILHSVRDRASFTGVAQIARGNGILAGLINWAVGFPRAGVDVPVTVTKIRCDAGEVWVRNFAGHIFRSVCLASPDRYHFRERLQALTFELALDASDDGLHLHLRRGWCLGLPIPNMLLPKSESREFVHEGRFHFDIAVTAPFGLGLIVHYRGWLLPEQPVPLTEVRH